MHNLRLYNGKSYFHIDYLLLTRFFIVIIDCKNYLDILMIDTTLNQFTQIRNNQEEGYLEPIVIISKPPLS
ncbi:nuclease-related domain-containing protein [Niallia sp.]|uniref:nuclease-related domain-containing protein n=1 Tax=Niallia sp. TaxID=2837523 RepID=UPI00289F8ED7|nr:nuclease-related domain-containing protein [Niallia sp.]